MFETYKHFRSCKNAGKEFLKNPLYAKTIENLENELVKQLDNESESWSQLNKRNLEIFTEAKTLLIEYLDKRLTKTTDKNQKKSLASIKNRVATVRLNKSHYCNSFNSNYNFVSHSIDTCNELLTYPDTTLFVIYAHELSHSIDPCSLQFSLSLINSENPFKQNQIFNESQPNNAYTTLPRKWALEDLMVDDNQLVTLEPPLPFKQNDFKNILNCLQLPDSVQAKKRKNKITNPTVADDEKMCSSSLQDGQMAEAFADWIAYEVLIPYLEKNRKTLDLKEAVYDGTLNIIANECSQLESNIELEMKKSINAVPGCKADNEHFLNFNNSCENKH
ncbi:MAG: hypothetical protein ACXVCY_09415 [Pseudobdellovibrionaceae bacterium]